MRVAVIDIGKTNAKVALVDTGTGAELGVVRRPNAVLPAPPYPHFDTERLWSFILEGLGALHRAHEIEAVTVTTHGASAALIDERGGLAAPILDYEHPLPDAGYDAIRPDFAVTGSPRVPLGLNLGAQLHFQLSLGTSPALVVTLPGYWTGRLCGRFASDASSFGAHTDLWAPASGRFSPLVERLGLTGKMAETLAPGTLLGPVTEEVAAATGLPEDTPVHLGIHDSNASLWPHLIGREPPFSVVSTGTWVIVMSPGANMQLDPSRDTLVNVDAKGRPVPSSRFMGGREFETLAAAPASRADAEAAMARGARLLPAIETGTGPFMGREARWSHDDLPQHERNGAVALYLAGMTETCLRLTGAEGDVIVEGPFAKNAAYLAALASVREVYASASATGTSQGAALLVDPAGARPLPERVSAPGPQWSDYVQDWLAAAED